MTGNEPEHVEAILRRYGVPEREIGRCCDDLSPHFRPPTALLGRRYTEPGPSVDVVWMEQDTEFWRESDGQWVRHVLMNRDEFDRPQKWRHRLRTTTTTVGPWKDGRR